MLSFYPDISFLHSCQHLQLILISLAGTTCIKCPILCFPYFLYDIKDNFSFPYFFLGGLFDFIDHTYITNNMANIGLRNNFSFVLFYLSFYSNNLNIDSKIIWKTSLVIDSHFCCFLFSNGILFYFCYNICRMIRL